MRFIFAMLVMFVSFASEASILSLTPKQQAVLHQSAEIGAEYGVSDMLPGLIFRESSLGRLTTDAGGRHFGVGHVNLATARYVAKRHPELGTISAARLRNDTELGLRIAALYLRECVDTFGHGQRALVCYNGGPGHAQRHTSTKYSRLVVKHNRDLQRFQSIPAPTFTVEREVFAVDFKPQFDFGGIDCFIQLPQYNRTFWTRTYYVAGYDLQPCTDNINSSLYVKA